MTPDTDYTAVDAVDAVDAFWHIATANTTASVNDDGPFGITGFALGAEL